MKSEKRWRKLKNIRRAPEKKKFKRSLNSHLILHSVQKTTNKIIMQGIKNYFQSCQRYRAKENQNKKTIIKVSFSKYIQSS